MDAYDRVGRRNSRWDPAARDFLARAVPPFAGTLEPGETAALLPAADALVRAGCDDPVVLLLAGWLHANADPESPEANPLLARAVEGFRTVPYPRGTAQWAAATYIEDCNGRLGADPDRSLAARQLQLAWFEQALTDGSYRPENADEQIVLAQHLATRLGDSFFETNRAACMRALEAAGDDGRVAPWVRLYLSGKRHVADAWDARGNGYANTVTGEGWQGFSRALALARRDLVESWRLNPARPEAATIMITVVMGESATPDGETERGWFDRATAAQFDYGPAYDKFLWSLRPRWGGSERAMFLFGLACADTRQFDTTVPAVLAQAARDVAGERENWSAAFSDPLVAKRFAEVYAGYAAAPGLSPTRRREWASEAVMCAFFQDHYAETYRALAALDYRLDPEICRRWRERDSQRVAEHLAIRVSPAQGRIFLADRAERDGQPARAADLLRAVLAEPAGREPNVASYLRRRLAVLEMSGHLATVPAAWQPFLPAGPALGGVPAGRANAATGGWPGWEVKLGRWEAGADGILRGRPGACGMMLVSDTAVGTDWEWQADLEPAPGPDGAWQAGLVFGYPDGVSRGQHWRNVRLQRNARGDETVTVGQTFGRGRTAPVKLGARNRLLVQSWRGRINVFVNGRPALSTPAPEPFKDGWVNRPDARVGFGGYADDNRAEVRFRDVQLRRLLAEPAPPAPAGTAADRQVSR